MNVLPTPQAAPASSGLAFSTKRWDDYCEENKEPVRCARHALGLGGYNGRQSLQDPVQGRDPRPEACDAEVHSAEPWQGVEHELERGEGQFLRRGEEGLSVLSTMRCLLFHSF